MCTNEAEMITLEFDNGEAQECEVLGVFDLDGKEYIALAAEDDDVYLYLYHELDEDGFELLDITDDAEFEKVCAEFERLMEEDEEE